LTPESALIAGVAQSRMHSHAPAYFVCSFQAATAQPCLKDLLPLPAMAMRLFNAPLIIASTSSFVITSCHHFA